MDHKITVRALRVRSLCFRLVEQPGFYRVHMTNRGPLDRRDTTPRYDTADVVLVANNILVNLTKATAEPFWREQNGGGYILLEPLGPVELRLKLPMNPNAMYMDAD